MNTRAMAITRRINEKSAIEYHVSSVSDWDGFDSLVKYLQKYWHAQVVESDDSIYSRRWVLRVNDVPISFYHDSQIGNFFLREDACNDQTLLEKIETDLIQRLS